MPDELICSDCGAKLSPETQGGLCVRCLFTLGLNAEADTEAAATVVPITEKAGDRIGRYKLLQKIGEGGCGVVYMAEQEVPVRRKVALKVIKLGMDTGEVIARFEAERQALALMDHPNIAKILDGGATEAGRPYFVMELVRGVRITEYCDQHQLPTRERLNLLIKVCQAIQHAHQKGIIHRDIKPSNILVTVNDGQPVPKVIDFGIAKATEGRLTDKTLFTAFQQFMGTPAYMSPEQAEMTSLDIDTRSDIYSLGVVLYELLTGKTPFDAKELLASGLDAMRRTIREQEPMRPSTRLSTLLAADQTEIARRRHTEPPKLTNLLRGDLDWIVMKCLEKDRSRRYEVASGLAMEIQRHLDNEPVVARPPSSAYRFQKLLRRHKLAFAAGLSVAAALIIGLGGATWMFLKEKSARQRAERAEADAEARLHEANLNWVRANRLIGRPGQRFASLAELARAAARTNRLDLRNEAIACLALPDLRPLKQWTKTRWAKERYWDSFRFSPSFRVYGTNDEHGNLTVRDTVTDVVQYQLSTPVAQGAPLTAAIASPDERFLATSDMAGRAWLWDLRARTARPIDFPRGASLLTFPDSLALVVRHNDGSFHFLSSTNGLEQKSIPVPSKVSWCRFDPTGEMFLTVIGGQALVHRTADGQVVRTLNLPVHASRGIRYAAWHPDGRRIALAWDASLGLWDAETGSQLSAFEGHEGAIVNVGFSSTGEWLVSTSWDCSTRVWHTDTHRETLRFPDSGNALRLSEKDSQLAFDSWDSTRVQLHDLAIPSAVQRFILPAPTLENNHQTAQAVFSPGGEVVAVADKKGVYLFQPPNPTPLAHLRGQACQTAQFQPDGLALLTSGSNGVCRWPMAWSADHSELRLGPPATLEPLRGQHINWFALSHDGQWMVAATEKRFLGFDPAKSVEAIRADAGIQIGSRPSLSPDGHLAATIAVRSLQLQIWNPRTGVLITNLPARQGWEAAFSPDGRWLACAAADVTTFWSTEDWSPRHRIPRALERIGRGSMAFSPGGRFAAISVADSEIRLMGMESGEELATLPSGRLLTYLAFSPSGDRFAAVFEPGYLHFWNLRKLREELAAMNLDWPGAPFPPDRTATGKIRITVVQESSTPANSIPSQPVSQ